MKVQLTKKGLAAKGLVILVLVNVFVHVGVRPWQ